ncbi:hypothetical protein [Falsirhodobacter sp. 20TX0035]|uniref:hypothetical protein n=1 Tax=Falsirhodobacter sp. 20TX0035 TaxID=3022019 RepID=UPI00232BE619|nr:hypothetical protein [Falsirhodobacter sp. 20TX0035]MDB6454735.1 hypothetical protein [Falsirhodobacter sp. 20TX0035]
MTWTILGYEIAEARLALIVAILAACFTGWQAWSGHLTARVALASQRRKDPAFEISSHPIDKTEGWVKVDIVARNFEEVGFTITGYRYKHRGAGLVHPDEIARDDGFSSWEPQPLLLAKNMAKKELTCQHGVGAGGRQTSLSNAPHALRPTRHLSIYATDAFDKRHLQVLWEWADGTKR